MKPWSCPWILFFCHIPNVIHKQILQAWKDYTRLWWLLIFSTTLAEGNINSQYIICILLTRLPAFTLALPYGLCYTQGPVVILICKSLPCLFSGSKSPMASSSHSRSKPESYIGLRDLVPSLLWLSLPLLSTLFPWLQSTGLLDIPGTY